MAAHSPSHSLYGDSANQLTVPFLINGAPTVPSVLGARQSSLLRVTGANFQVGSSGKAKEASGMEMSRSDSWSRGRAKSSVHQEDGNGATASLLKPSEREEAALFDAEAGGTGSPHSRRFRHKRSQQSRIHPKLWRRGTTQQIVKARRPKCNLVSIAVYAAMVGVLVLGAVVGDEYWNSAIKLDILQTLHISILGALASAFSNAAQTIFFLSYFGVELWDFFTELRSGALRNYSSAWEYVPLTVGRTAILTTSVFNSVPVVLASDNNIEIGMLSLTLMALMNYDAVSKLADYLYLKGRDKFARSPETKYRLTLEKDLQYWISQIGRFYSEADLDGRRAIKDIILAGSMKDLDSELRVLKTIISKIGELKSWDDQTLIQHFTRPLISSDSVPLSSYLPSCSVANGLRLGLGLCFVQYAFDQFSSVVFGISKIVGQGPVGAPVAFTLGIMSMLISLTRYGVWAGKLVDKFEDAWNLSKKNPELKYWIRAALGFGAVSAFLSPGGSIEVALKGIKNYDNVELYKLAPVFKFYVDHHLELPLAIGPGFISGAVVNCPGNMNIAVQALLAIDYLCQLYRKSDRAPFLETLEDRAVSDVFNLIKAMVGDNRHFSGEDILKMHNGLDVRTLVLERSQHQADDLSATRSAAADRNQPVAKATGGGLRRLASTPFLHAADRATTPAGSHQAQGGRDEFRPIPVHKPREEKGSRSSSSSNEA